METVVQAAHKVNRSLVARNVSLTINTIGCAQAASASIEEALGVCVTTLMLCPLSTLYGVCLIVCGVGGGRWR